MHHPGGQYGPVGYEAPCLDIKQPSGVLSYLAEDRANRSLKDDIGEVISDLLKPIRQTVAPNNMAAYPQDAQVYNPSAMYGSHYWGGGFGAAPLSQRDLVQNSVEIPDGDGHALEMGRDAHGSQGGEDGHSSCRHFGPICFACSCVCILLLVLARVAGLDWPWKDESSMTTQYDCSVGYKEWPTAWTLDKRSFCCRATGRGCSQLDASSCYENQDKWEMSWSYDKRHFCCKAIGTGCVPSKHISVKSASAFPAVSFECDVEAESWRTSWSDVKKEWCCRHRSKGCS